MPGAGRWESRIGIPGSRHIYLGLFNNEETAARNYDRSLVRLRGPGAATNFGLADYRSDLADYHKMQQVGLVMHSPINMGSVILLHCFVQPASEPP